ncbi:MAG: CoA transferase [Castellaniella sp.]|uniref:CaiB/BaiF CoA transferase family protein n=1 Tax=Castellaniella sp. TaxID=1955812 RepID=UPI001214F18C|nr:CoA transferase [Castellaniella sp.]TAN25888.1 MAG: CoA transferase [Castellaniella sp.]
MAFGLEGVRILSFNHFFMGPVGVQHLGDLGADVISVEPIQGAFQRKWGGTGETVDGQTMLQLAGNRNKRSLALNLKDPRGVEIARQLIATVDVLAENYRPGVMDGLGLGYEAARAIKPDIIYAAASGFGTTGPYVNRPGQDLIIQAMSGLAAITGDREHGPRAVGVSVVDHHGAALYAMGILAALLRRERTGQGGRVDVNLLSSAIDLQQESFVCYLNSKQPPADIRQPGRVSGWYFPAPYGVYPSRDGHLAISLCPLETIYDVLGVPASERIPEAEAFQRQEDISTILAHYLIRETTAHWVDRFEERHIWYSPVNDYAAVLADPQVRHLQSFAEVEGWTGTPVGLVSHPVRYDGQAPGVRLPPQALGAQTQEILGELGLNQETIEGLRNHGVVSWSDSSSGSPTTE